MKKIILLALTVLMALAVALPAGAGHKDKHPEKPVNVWVCHFPGHEREPVTLGSGTVIDGDYILNNVDGTPTAGQTALCEAQLGGHLINPSSRGAVNGHDADFQNRIDEYRD